MTKLVTSLIAAVIFTAMYGIVLFFVSLHEDSKKINKGYCPVCRQRMKPCKFDGKIKLYECPSMQHYHVVAITNRFINWKYWRKSK